MPVLDVDRVPFFEAFFSYASTDREIVEPLAQRLTEGGLDVFFDAWFIQPGQNIPKVLLTALRKSHRVVALMTPDYFQSPWTDFELNWNFVETQLASAGAESAMIPVVLRPCDLPKELRALKHIDATGTQAAAGYAALASVLSRTSLAIESYVVPSGVASQYLAEFVAKKLQRFFGFRDDRQHDFMVVYSELVSNAFAHVKDADNRVEVTVRADSSRVTLDVSDRGPGVDLAAHIERSKEPSGDGPSRPHGLQVAHRLCTRLTNQIRGERHVVTAVLDRDPVDTVGSLSELDRQPDLGAPRFRCFIDPRGRYAYAVIATGRVNLYNEADVTDFLRPFGAFEHVVLDLEAVAYVDSAGLGALVKLAGLVRKHGGRVDVVCTKRVADLIRANSLDTVLQIVSSREEAIRTLTALP
jgi:anti-anti-sigma factor